MPVLLELDSVEACAKTAASLGLQFVELNMNFPYCTVDVLNAGELKSLASRYGIYFTLHLEENLNPFEFNREVADAWTRSAATALRFAEDADIKLVNMHLAEGIYITLPDTRVYLYGKYNERYMSSVERFRSIVENAAGSATICIETCGGWKPHERAAIEYLLESPRFGLTFDIGHSHACGDADEDFVLAHNDRLLHMHVHDAKGKQNHLALGDGDIDISARLALAKKCGCRCVLETKTLEALERSVIALRSNGIFDGRI